MEEITCQLCRDSVPKEAMSFHKALDQALLDVVLKDHPDWKEPDGMCKRCWSVIEKKKRELDRIKIEKKDSGNA